MEYKISGTIVKVMKSPEKGCDVSIKPVDSDFSHVFIVFTTDEPVELLEKRMKAGEKIDITIVI